MIKIYDSSSDKYVTVASNRGDKLYTKSINFINPAESSYEDSSIITLDDALTSIANEIKDVKEGIAWVYKNGTVGGGGGTGSGSPKFKVTTNDAIINNNSIIINNNQTLNLTFNITGTSTGRKMNISIRDNYGNFYSYNNSTYTVSTKGTTIQIPNITNDLIIEFSGYDQETLTIIESYTLSIKVSTLKITGPTNVEVSKSDTEYNITYDITTTFGQMTYIILSTNVNNILYEYTSDIFSNSQKITFDIFSIFKDLNLADLLKGDAPIDNMELNAKVISGDYSNEISTSIVFTAENKISVDIIPINSIIGTEPSYEYMENDNISFTIKLYFSSNEFYMYYKLYQIIDNTENIVYEKGNINDPISDENKISSTQFYSKTNPITLPYPSTINSNYPVYVYVKSWDKNNQEINGERIKWFKIKSDENWKPYNLSLSGLDTHIDGGLNYLYYEYNSNTFGNIEISDKIKSSRYYKGSSINQSIINGYLKYYNSNNITNGVLLRGKSNEIANTLRMSSKSYGVFYDNNDKPFMPFDGNNNNWMLNDEGWTISLSFISDLQFNDESVLFSCASFDNLGNFSEGIYITTSDVNVKFTNSTKQVGKWNLNAKLSSNIYNQVDITYQPKTYIDDNNRTINVGELKLYVNGVLASAGIETNINFQDNNYYPTILSNTTIGCSHDGKTYSNFADANFYRILFYKRALTPYHITKNLIQGNAEVNLLDDGNINRILNNELRAKNFFNTDGTCLIIDDTTYTTDCKYISNLYSTLSTSTDNPLPIVLIKTTSDFRSIVDNRYTESEVAEDKGSSNPTITREYNAVITLMKEKSNKQFIMGQTAGSQKIGDNSGKDCTVKLQGTSTLGNESKNFEISFGAATTKDNIAKENLVQVFDDMLPENSWILKADVMDSGHANNAAIGSFINDFLSTYKTTANQQTQNSYASEIKATTAGHPVMLFMQFGDNAPQEFLGIYSFNLGRISYYNLGYQIFDGYYKVKSDINSEEKVVIYKNHKIEDTTIEFPALVSSYETIAIPYTSDLVGVDTNSTTAVCYECNGNNNIVGSFQQSDSNIINDFYYRVYPNIDNTNSTTAFERLRKLFVATSNLYDCDPEYLCKMEEGDDYLKTRSLLMRNSEGNFYNTETNQYEQFNKNNYNLNKYKLQQSWEPADRFASLQLPQTNENENHVGLNWEFASAYFTLAMLFGLTDSLGKNLNIRSFNLADWYISFYDMDTGLGLTNAGYETVKNDVYLDKFKLDNNKQEINVEINGYKEGGYDTINSRLFNIIRFFTNKEYTTTGTKPSTNYRKIWEDIRKTILKDPNDFIDNYYIKQNKNVGEILFNYDYDIKYINDEIDMIIKPTSDIKGSINFLHGNRVNFVRDWFTTHVFFLDGVFDIKCQAPLTSETTQLYGNAAGTQYYGIRPEGNIESDTTFNVATPGVVCPYISFSNQSDRVNPSFDGYKDFTVKSNIPMFFIYNNGTRNQRLFINEKELTNIKLYFKSGNEQTMSFNYAPYLTLFNKFGTLSYVSINRPNLSALTELDLSNSKVLSGAQDSFNLSSLIELRKLNMNNVLTTSGSPLQVDLQNASKISYIDLRFSNISDLTLPGYGNNPGGSLEEIYLDQTYIKNVDLSGHAMLKKFSAYNCKNLTSLIFNYNTLLENIGTLPSSLKTFKINECNMLENLDLSNMEYLSNDSFEIGHLENLKSFKYSFKRNNTANSAFLTKIDLSGCPNLEYLSLTEFGINDPNNVSVILNINCQKTLKNINISSSAINHIIWYDPESKIKYIAKIDNSIDGVLDLRDCINLSDIDIRNNKRIKYLLLNEYNDYINNLNINYCDNLIRVTGKINIDINKFKGLFNFRFNELCKYDSSDTTSHIIINENIADVEFDLNDSNLKQYLDENNKIIFNGDYDINDEYTYYINYELDKLLTHYEFNNDGSLKDAFSATGINISDVYLILKKLEKWTSVEFISETNKNGFISEFNNTFFSCKNIKTGIIDSKYMIEQKDIKFDIFNNFKYLKNLISTFTECSNINGYLTDNNDDYNVNHISIFPDTIEQLCYVFNGCGKLKINSYIFDKCKNIIMIDAPFSNSTTHILNIYNNSIKPKYLFKNLSNIESIINLFTNTKVNIQLYGDDGDINQLFINNTKLKTINRIFPNDFPSALTLYNVNTLNLSDIFGGYTRYRINSGEITDENQIMEFNKKYPRKLENLSYAFATNGTDYDQQPVLNWDNMDYIFYNLDIKYVNGKYINDTLKRCDYMFDKLAYVKSKDNDQYFDYQTGTDDNPIAKFPINMFNIKHKDENGNLCDVEFSALSNLTGLFKRAAFYDELKFPGNIFKYCTANKLNISHLLEDTVMTPIKLVTINDVDENGEKYACFSNCKLDNVEALFKNCFKCSDYTDVLKDISNGIIYKNSIHAKYDRGGLHGIIPYKFFYNIGNGISNMQNIFEGCKHLGVTYDENGNFTKINKDNLYFANVPNISTLIDVSNGIKDYSYLLDLVEKDENNNYIWNTWSYDGTVFENNYLNVLKNIKINNESYLDAKHNAINDYILIKYNGTKDIKNMDKNTLINEISLSIKNNTLNSLLNDNCYIKHDSEFTVIDDINYIKIYVDTDYDIKNVNYNDYKNENGDYAFNRLWNCDNITYINNTGDNINMIKYQHEIINNNAATKTSKLFINNYMLPMDIFRYCSSTCNINCAFKNVGSFNNKYKSNKYDNNIYGIIGRIPPRLFEKLSNTIELIDVFYDYKKVNPYSQSLTGQYNTNILNNNKLLENISGLFSGNMILGNLHIDTFVNNLKLNNVSNLYKNSYMVAEYGLYNNVDNDYTNFINNNIFRNNSNLSNLSNMFSRDIVNELQNGYLYFDITSELLTNKQHPYISNASSMFMNQSYIQRDNSQRDNWIDWRIGWAYINKNYTNCYTGSNFNLNDIPISMGGNKNDLD